MVVKTGESMASSKPTALIIVADRKLSAALVSGIESAGYDVTTASSSEVALQEHRSTDEYHNAL
jgi:ActR/RegA family two-component response regulator